MRTMQEWNKIIKEETFIARTASESEDNGKDWNQAKQKLRELLLAFLDWCEEEGLFQVAREFIRSNIMHIEPSLICKEKGVLFFWKMKGRNCEQLTAEILMTTVEEQEADK